MTQNLYNINVNIAVPRLAPASKSLLYSAVALRFLRSGSASGIALHNKGSKLHTIGMPCKPETPAFRTGLELIQAVVLADLPCINRFTPSQLGLSTAWRLRFQGFRALGTFDSHTRTWQERPATACRKGLAMWALPPLQLPPLPTSSLLCKLWDSTSTVATAHERRRKR